MSGTSAGRVPPASSQRDEMSRAVLMTDVTREVELPVTLLGVTELEGEMSAAFGGIEQVASFQGGTTIERNDYGVGTGSWAATLVVGGDRRGEHGGTSRNFRAGRARDDRHRDHASETVPDSIYRINELVQFAGIVSNDMQNGSEHFTFKYFYTIDFKYRRWIEVALTTTV